MMPASTGRIRIVRSVRYTTNEKTTARIEAHTR